jgi:exonuclease VII small subunit
MAPDGEQNGMNHLLPPQPGQRRHKTTARQRVSVYAPAYWRMIFLLLYLGFSAWSYAACGEEISATTQALIAEEQALRATEQTVRASRTRLQTSEVQLQDLLAQPPATYDQTLARKLAMLRRTEVEPKRRTLENLRVQHEESRKQWERGHRLLNPQLAKAQTAFQAKTITQAEFCRVRETYQQALRLYLQGMQSYRRGMDFYARALNECVDRFFTPYLNGFTDPRQWEALIAQLQGGDFLHDILVPMTANAIQSTPPDTPPE